MRNLVLILAVALGLSCSIPPSGHSEASTAYRISSPQEQREITFLATLKSSTCKVIRASGLYGSGVAFKRDGSKTYILSAKHVFESVQDWEREKITVQFTKNTKEFLETAKLVRLSKVQDLALLVVEDSFLSISELSLEAPVVGTDVLAVGFPAGIFPGIVTVGEVVKMTDEGMYDHNAGIYFGNSGGPLVLASNGRVVGINVWIWNRYNKPRSDEGSAVGLVKISEFLNEK